MGLPTLNKTHQFRPNVAVPAQGSALASNRRILRLIKDALTTTTSWVDDTNTPVVPSNMWTVRYSCDSVTAGTVGDGVDRWAADSNLVWANAGSAHSWIVLRQAAINSTFEILISCEGISVNGNILTIYKSPSAAFSGGTATARPTAVDEQVVLNNTAWGGAGSIDTSTVFHVMKASDGQLWRIISCVANAPNTLWIFDKAASLIGGSWANPCVSLAIGSANTNVCSVANIATAGSAPFAGRGVSAMTLWGTIEAYKSTPSVLNSAQNSPNDLSGTYPFLGIGLVSETASNRGKHGYLIDIWWGLQSVNTGDNYPDAGSPPNYQFAQFGHLIFPWCRVLPQTA